MPHRRFASSNSADALDKPKAAREHLDRLVKILAAPALRRVGRRGL
jgi:hypothetical protein